MSRKHETKSESKLYGHRLQIGASGGVEYSVLPPPPHAMYSVVDGIGSVMDISYDKNGNILGLKRLARNNGVHFEFDNLSYYYDDNRLIGVDDAIGGQTSLDDFHDAGWKYGLYAIEEYEYDPNGNMHWDVQRELKIEYGLVHNMPVYMQHDAGAMANHYAFDGRKLGKKVYNQQNSLIYDERYYDELLIKDGAPSRIQHDEGFITLNQAGQPVHFCYYLKDHLGNVRSLILPTGGQPGIKQANDYYPFGMSYSNAPGANKHKYNSKEEQEMPGKWLDYGARFYDAQLARWHGVDPLAEKYFPFSPYAYAANNPVLFLDPDGREIVISGALKNEALNQIQSRVGDKITLSLNEDGKVSFTNNTGKKLRGDAKRVAEMIDNKSITVNLVTVDGDQTSTGNLFVGGAFMGNEVTKDSDGNISVSARQEVNPSILGAADEHTKTPGKMMMHEVTESYEGAKISQKNGVSVGPAYANQSNPVYNKAHLRATAQTPVHLRMYDRFGKEVTDVKQAHRLEWYVVTRSGKEGIIKTSK